MYSESMKKRKINTESTVVERLRMLIGVITFLAGSMIIGLFSFDPTFLIVGLVLCVAGLRIANIPKVDDFFIA